MYFHNKLIWSYKCEYYLLETWSNVKHSKWHATYSYILLGIEAIPSMWVYIYTHMEMCS
jgi:hypothetical protein